MRGLSKYLVYAAIAVSASAASTTPVSAQLITLETAIPDSEVLLNFNGTGLDWVYAGPIAPNEFGPGMIQPATYRAGEGWRVATAEEWLSRPIWSDFIRDGYSLSLGNTVTHENYRFTSEYWSTFTHVDVSDYALGRVTDGVNGYLSGVPETIYVRSSLISNVPEPATWAMMLIGFGAVGYSMRRRRKEQQVLRMA